MTKPLIQKVDCVRLYVADLESGLSFYRDRLGLDLIWRTEQAVGLRMPNDETEIVLHAERPGTEIDLQVECADDAAAQIEQAGGQVVVPPFDIQIGRCDSSRTASTICWMPRKPTRNLVDERGS